MNTFELCRINAFNTVQEDPVAVLKIDQSGAVAYLQRDIFRINILCLDQLNVLICFNGNVIKINILNAHPG